MKRCSIIHYLLGAAIICATLITVILPCRVAHAVEIRALDEAAIPVKDPTHVFLISVARAGHRLVAVGDHGVIIFSDDSGITWKQAAVPVSAELTAVGFATPMDGWAVGHYGVILRTGDGGATWQTISTGVQVDQIILAAAQAAVAANDPALGTPLAMRRAEHFIADGPDTPFLTLWTLSPNEMIAFGAYRMALRTTDGGKSLAEWSLHIADAYSHNLYGVATVGGDLFLAGEGGLIFRSTDGGNSFTPVATPAAATMFGIIGTGGSVFAYGVAGHAYRSDDNGKTWTSVPLGTDVNLTSACVLHDGTLIVANEFGTLYISRDHARSFTPLPKVQPMAVFDMVEAADHSLIAVGNAGVLRILPSEFDQS